MSIVNEEHKGYSTPNVIKLIDPNHSFSDTTKTKLGSSFTLSLTHPLSLSLSPTLSLAPPRLSVRVSGGDALVSGPGGGLGCLARDLATMSFESPCDIGDKTSSPFSSNRTMFETEEVRHARGTARRALLR